ncbi:hypothetical protein, partial [Streptomyces sp. NPDC088554]|uniref:hypothetical protein n=1 Tax=Streptomyces sp. NPDC088554 TaxID=3365865 RepID=UPI003817F09C
GEKIWPYAGKPVAINCAVFGRTRGAYGDRRQLPKVRLQHAFSATAVNIVRLDAYWSGHPLDRNRTSRLTRLSHQLTG